MVNILIVEDNKTNSKLLKLLVEGFAKENFEEYSIDIAENGFEALGMLEIKKYDLMFLDVKMPKYDGVSLLTTLQNNKHIHIPYICMATSFGEEKYKMLYNLKGANAYLIKPIQKEKLYMVIQKALNHKIKIEDIAPAEEISQLENEEEFFDFDDDFLDLEEEIVEENQQTQINEANKTHAHVNAQEFLSEIDMELYQDALDDIDDLYEMLKGRVSPEYIQEDIELITDLLGKYSTFLNNFPDFYEISYSLNTLKEVLNNLDINEFPIKHQEYISSFIFLLLKDVYTWREDVFEKQDTIDVYYINASALSNSIQLQNFINTQKAA